MITREIPERKMQLASLRSHAEPVPLRTIIKQILISFYCRGLLPKWTVQRLNEALKLKDA